MAPRCWYELAIGCAVHRAVHHRHCPTQYLLQSALNHCTVHSACHVLFQAAGVFSPGNPAAFQQHFLAGQALLQQLEAMASSRAAVERLRSSTAAAGWAKRWNLAVYFSLVYQDIAGNTIQRGCHPGVIWSAWQQWCKVVAAFHSQLPRSSR